METILLTPTKWSLMAILVFLQESFALEIAFWKFRHSEYPKAPCRSRANQYSMFFPGIVRGQLSGWLPA